MLDHPVFHSISIGTYKREIFSNISVIIWYLNNPLIELSKGEINSQHSMLYFHKEITA